MSRQPAYPKDAAVGGKDPGAGGKDPGAGGDPGRGSPDGSKRSKKVVAGAAIGVGSAAIVAALLYAKKRKSER